jgi:hypothetical protein
VASKSKGGSGRQMRTVVRPPAVTWAQAFRDVLLASFNNGLFAFVACWLLILFMVWKMPEADVSKLVFEIIGKLEKYELWAYILLTVVLATWYFHARSMRRNFASECERIGREKSALQNSKGLSFPSSEGRN